MRLRTLPVFLAFLAMGFGDAVGPFVGLAKNEFQLSNTAAATIPFLGFIMFGLLSLDLHLVLPVKASQAKPDGISVDVEVALARAS